MSSDGFACVGLLKYWKVVKKDLSDAKRRNVFTRHDGKDFRITPYYQKNKALELQRTVFARKRGELLVICREEICHLNLFLKYP